VPAIFTEASINPKLLEQVGAEANVKVVTDLYIDSLGDKGSEAGTYLDFFRADVNKLVNCVKVIARHAAGSRISAWFTKCVETY